MMNVVFQWTFPWKYEYVMKTMEIYDISELCVHVLDKEKFSFSSYKINNRRHKGENRGAIENETQY